MAEKVEKRTIGDSITKYSSLVLIGISIVTFVALLPYSFSQAGSIGQFEDQILGFQSNLLTQYPVYLFLVLVLAAVLVSIFSVFYNRDSLTMGFQKKTNDGFFRYFVIFILVQVILSEFVAYFIPNIGQGFPFNQSLGIQNFIFSFLPLEQTFLFELIPMSIISVALTAFRGKSAVKSLFFYEFGIVETIVVSVMISLVATLIVGGTPVEYISDYLSFFLLNVIFLRFGFLKAFLTNFTVSMVNVVATVLSTNPALSAIVLPVLLFYLGFLGIYSLVQIGIRAPDKLQAELQNMPRERPERQQKSPPVDPFVRSRCPECGNAVFHVISASMALKCSKCGRELEKDAMGPENIKIEYGRVSRYEAR